VVGRRRSNGIHLPDEYIVLVSPVARALGFTLIICRAARIRCRQLRPVGGACCGSSCRAINPHTTDRGRSRSVTSRADSCWSCCSPSQWLLLLLLFSPAVKLCRRTRSLYSPRRRSSAPLPHQNHVTGASVIRRPRATTDRRIDARTDRPTDGLRLMVIVYAPAAGRSSRPTWIAIREVFSVYVCGGMYLERFNYENIVL